MTTDAQYIAALDLAWSTWVTQANAAATGPQWDTAWATYVSSVEAARIAHGHPPGKPKKRP